MCVPGGSTVHVHLVATPSVADATWTLAVTELERSLRQVALDLESLDRRFAVVGGLAVAIRAEPRLTRDVDVALPVVDDADAEQVINALRGRGYDVVAIVEHEVAGRLSTVRLVRRGGDAGLFADLLLASSGVEPACAYSQSRPLRSIGNKRCKRRVWSMSAASTANGTS
jgi:hypothetical protein